ncbi:hypothetical protein [Pseudonocardia alni]|uniref:hypothetical protein n=1 Tax=Pseudonocardia alni TaxID=33907 RepID=UPI00331F0712
MLARDGSGDRLPLTRTGVATAARRARVPLSRADTDAVHRLFVALAMACAHAAAPRRDDLARDAARAAVYVDTAERWAEVARACRR